MRDDKGLLSRDELCDIINFLSVGCRLCALVLCVCVCVCVCAVSYTHLTLPTLLRV